MIQSKAVWLAGVWAFVVRRLKMLVSSLTVDDQTKKTSMGERGGQAGSIRVMVFPVIWSRLRETDPVHDIDFSLDFSEKEASWRKSGCAVHRYMLPGSRKYM